MTLPTDVTGTLDGAAVAALGVRIDSVRERIAAACQRSSRAAGEVTLVGVSKTVDATVMAAAARYGLRHFGENRVPDAERKWVELARPELSLHLVGQVQSNKARVAARIADLIESVDRPSLVKALDAEVGRLVERGERPDGFRLALLVQVNVAGEEQKAGCAPDAAAALVEAILATSTLRLDGLMTIAPLVGTPEEARPTFAGLRSLRDRLLVAYPGASLTTLSMGMTNDFEVAIEEGATSVRVGRAIFAD